AVESVPGLQDPPRPAESSAPPAGPAAPQAKKSTSWVGHVLRPLSSQAPDKPAAADPLLAFASEHEQPKTPRGLRPAERPSPSIAWRKWQPGKSAVLPLAIAMAIMLSAAVTFALTRVSWSRNAPVALPTGRLTVVTRPAGAQLTVDG